MTIDGNRLKEMRESKGISQRQIAERCNISLSVYRKYEYGERNPKPAVFYKILHELVVPGYKIAGVTNADKIRLMTDFELTEFIYNVSNGATQISTCNEKCAECEYSDDFCIYQIGEWLISESDE